MGMGETRVKILAITNRGDRSLRGLSVWSPVFSVVGTVEFSELLGQYRDALVLGDHQIGERRPFLAKFTGLGGEGFLPGIAVREEMAFFPDSTEKWFVPRDGWRLAPGGEETD